MNGKALIEAIRFVYETKLVDSDWLPLSKSDTKDLIDYVTYLETKNAELEKLNVDLIEHGIKKLEFGNGTGHYEGDLPLLDRSDILKRIDKTEGIPSDST